MPIMTESPQPTTASNPPGGATQQKPYWLYRFAAWVGIIAGVVFIVSLIFFAGAYASNGGWRHQCHHHHHGGMFHHGRGDGMPGPMGPGAGGAGPGELPAPPGPSPAPPPGR